MYIGVPTLPHGSLGKRQANRAECHAAMWWRLDITVVATGLPVLLYVRAVTWQGHQQVCLHQCAVALVQIGHPMPPDDSAGT